MGYRQWLNFMDGIGFSKSCSYDYLDKDSNIASMQQYMLSRSNEMFKWHGLPDTIPETQLEKMLQCQGYAIIGKINGNVYACYGGLGGVMDEYYRPTKAIVSIPYFNFNAEWEIGKDCVVIRNDLMMQGLLPLYAKYCTLINECEISVLLSSVNQRIQAYLIANDDQSAASAMEFLKQVMEGRQGVIADDSLWDRIKVTELKSGSSTSIRQVIEALQYLRSSMFQEIGLASMPNQRREFISTAELHLNSDNLYPLVDDMRRSRKLGIEKANGMFGLELDVELNSSWDYRMLNGMSISNTQEGVSLEDIGLAGSEGAEKGGKEAVDEGEGRISQEDVNNERIVEVENAAAENAGNGIPENDAVSNEDGTDEMTEEEDGDVA